jgi:hypothetical protein
LAAVALLGVRCLKTPRRAQRRGFVFVALRPDAICGNRRVVSIHVAEPTQPSHLRTAAASELCEMLSALGLTQHRVAQLFGVGPRSVRRWQHGDRRVPCGVGIVLRLLAAGVVTVAQVEQAAVPIPARTNGTAQPKSIVADVKAAATPLLPISPGLRW